MAEKTAFLYSGQGSALVPIDRVLLDHPDASQLREAAESVMGPAFLGSLEPPKELQDTALVQPALYCLERAVTIGLLSAGAEPELAGGHSFGMIPACVTAGVLSELDGMRVASLRGELMSKASRETPGKMAAVLGETRQLVAQKLEGSGVVVACDNSSGQMVISGPQEAVEAVLARFKLKIPLQGSIAGHSPVMAPVQGEYRDALVDFRFAEPKIPLLLDTTGRIGEGAEEVRRGLVDQLTQPVEWVRCMETLLEQKVTQVVEIGSVSVLLKFLESPSPNLRLHFVNDSASLAALAKIAPVG